MDACGGMKYLNEQNIIHCDLGLRNLLIAFGASPISQYSVKVADFGLSKTIQDSEYYRTEGKELAVRWSAPESLLYGKFSKASDVWSFGVTIWELMSNGARPYVQYSNSETIEQVLQGYKLPKPDNCPDLVYDIMLLCWQRSPEARPTFAQLYDEINAMYPHVDMIEIQYYWKIIWKGSFISTIFSGDCR
jgi:serine/threonine protein kinase